MNCAIIGYGKMGKIRATYIERCGGKVVGIYDNLCYEIASRPEKLISDKNVDAVFICTPNLYNKNYTMLGLSNGKHVFCEKPPTMTLEDLKQVVEIEKQSNKKLMYGFNHRYHRSIRKLKQLIDDNVFGEIVWLRGRYGKSVDKDFIKGWRSDYKISGGGIFLDQGIHMLDLFIYFVGDFDEVHSMLTNTFWNIKGVEDNAFITMKNNNNGITASMHSTMANWRYMFSLEVFFKKGYAAVNGFKTPSGLYGDEELTYSKNKNDISSDVKESVVMTFKEDDSWEYEIQSFFDAIKNDSKIESGNSEDALKVMTLVDKIFEQNRGSLYGMD